MVPFRQLNGEIDPSLILHTEKYTFMLNWQLRNPNPNPNKNRLFVKSKYEGYAVGKLIVLDN